MPTPTFIVFDTETTGLPLYKQSLLAIEQPWMVQLGFVVTDEHYNVLSTYDSIVCPPPGAIHHPRATEVHGITEERCRDEGVPTKEAVEAFSAACRSVGEGFNVAYNRPFDNYIMRAAMYRTFDEIELEDLDEGLYSQSKPMCAMEQARGFLRVPGATGGYRNVKLEQAYRRITGKQLEGAHDALSDVLGALAVIKTIAETIIGTDSAS